MITVKQTITTKYIEQKILEEDLTTLEDSILEDNIFQTSTGIMDSEFYNLESFRNECHRVILNSILFDFLDINSLKYEDGNLYLDYFFLDNTTLIAENIKKEIEENKNKKYQLEWKLYSMMFQPDYNVKSTDSFIIKREKYYSFLLSFL